MSGKQLTILFLSLGLILLLSNTLFVVDEREKVVLKRLGKIHTIHEEPGLQWKIPLADEVVRFDSRILSLDNRPERFLTFEKKNLNVDYFVKWRIDDVDKYYRSTGGQESTALDRLSKIVKNSVKDEIAKRTVQQAVSGERTQIMRDLQASSSKEVAELGIEVVDVRIKRIDFNEKVTGSVYERMRAERVRDANEIRANGAEIAEKIRAEADRKREVLLAEAYGEAERLRGEGDATATEIYARAYQKDAEFYSFQRSLQVYEQSWQNREDVLILEPEGEFFRYFNPPAR